MGRKKGKSTEEAATPQRSASCPQGWAMVLSAIALIFVVALGLHYSLDQTPAQSPPPNGPDAQTPPRVSPPPGQAAAASSAPAMSTTRLPADIRSKLVGRWLRPDGGYVMTIKSVAEDGTVQVTYENPRPIHVANAFVKQVAAKTSLYVELRDRNYPGNNYELEFDAARDQFVGVYHHLGVQQNFDVYFERLK